MKITLLILITFSSSSFSVYGQNNTTDQQKKEQKVYICNSTTSKKYHYSKDCKALTKCNDTVVPINLRKAKYVYGRTICGFETHKETSKTQN